MKLRAALAIMMVVAFSAARCGPKKTKFQPPTTFLEAKTASEEELVELVNRYAALDSLTVARMQIEFTGGSLEKGYLEEYPTAKGHIVARRPDSVYLNILNPVTSSTVVTMSASQGRFQIWAPRENKFLVGSTDLPVDGDNPLHSVRPDHLLEAMLIEPVTANDLSRLYFVQEDQDAVRKYYVLHELDIASGGGNACLVRKLWVERSGLHLARQQLFDCGQLISTADYGTPVSIDDRLVGREVTVKRIGEHYTIRLRFEEGAIRVDRELKDSAFQIPLPSGAELIEVKPNSDGEQEQ